jgi:hypothetical protein
VDNIDWDELRNFKHCLGRLEKLDEDLKRLKDDAKLIRALAKKDEANGDREAANAHLNAYSNLAEGIIQAIDEVWGRTARG